MKKWCETYLSDYAFVEIDDRILDEWFQLSLLKFSVKKHDLIFLRGGGSVGNLLGCGLGDLNLVKIDLKFLGHNLCDLGVQTLTHFGAAMV